MYTVLIVCEEWRQKNPDAKLELKMHGIPRIGETIYFGAPIYVDGDEGRLFHEVFGLGTLKEWQVKYRVGEVRWLAMDEPDVDYYPEVIIERIKPIADDAWIQFQNDVWSERLKDCDPAILAMPAVELPFTTRAWNTLSKMYDWCFSERWSHYEGDITRKRFSDGSLLTGELARDLMRAEGQFLSLRNAGVKTVRDIRRVLKDAGCWPDAIHP